MSQRSELSTGSMLEGGLVDLHAVDPNPAVKVALSVDRDLRESRCTILPSL